MARQLPNSNNMMLQQAMQQPAQPQASQAPAPQSPAPKQRREPKQKQEKSGGFFSKIFGSKSKQPAQQPQQTYPQQQNPQPQQTPRPQQHQQHPQPQQPNPYQQQPNPYQQQPNPYQQPQQYQQPNPYPHPYPQQPNPYPQQQQYQQPNPYQQQPNPYPQQPQPQYQQLMTDDQANQIYNKQLLEQILFVYIEPQRQEGVFNIIKQFNNIKPVMPPDAMSLTSFYRKNNIAGNILLFLFNPNEVEPVAQFLREMDFSTINPSLMTIRIVRDKDLDIGSILQIPNVSKFCKVARIDKLIFSENMLHTILADIVKKQPIYPELQKVTAPEKANLMVDKKTFKVDFDRITKSLASARAGSQEVELMEIIKKKILAMSSTNDSLESIKETLPQLKLLKDIEQELSREIEKIKYKDGFKEELAQMLTDKLLISTLGTKELKDYLQVIIQDATEEKMNAQNTLTSITPEDIERINTIHEDTVLMMQKRNELERKVTESYNNYLIQSQTVINATKLEERRCIEVNNEMVELLRENIVPESMQEGMETYLARIKSLREEVNNLSQKTTQELTSAFQMANTLLKDQSSLIKIDNVLLAALQQEVELLNKTQNTVMVVDSGLKARGTLLYKVSGGHMRNIFDLVLDESDLIVSIRNRESEEHLNIGKSILNAEEMLDMIPEEFKNLKELTEIQLERDESNIDRILTTIDYISKYFRRVYIVIPLDRTLDEDEIHTTEEAFRNALAKVTFWTVPEANKMILINSVITRLVYGYSNLLQPIVVFNDVPKEMSPETFDRLLTEGNFPIKTHTYTIPHLKSLESGLKPNPTAVDKIRQVVHNI